jgi:hypothetical protein
MGRRATRKRAPSNDGRGIQEIQELTTRFQVSLERVPESPLVNVPVPLPVPEVEPAPVPRFVAVAVPPTRYRAVSGSGTGKGTDGRFRDRH